MKLLAAGEAQRVRALGEAEADKAARVGVAQALAIEEQVRAYGGPQLQLTQQVMSRFAEAIAGLAAWTWCRRSWWAAARTAAGGAGRALAPRVAAGGAPLGQARRPARPAPAAGDGAGAAYRDRIRREVTGGVR